MPRNTRTAALALAAVLAAGLTGCGTVSHTERASFPLAGTTLRVVNPSPNMPVTASRGPAGSVGISVTTQTIGKSASTPAWRLTGDVLDLGTPCAKGYVGFCEGSYHLSVPEGVSATLGDRPLPVR